MAAELKRLREEKAALSSQSPESQMSTVHHYDHGESNQATPSQRVSACEIQPATLGSHQFGIDEIRQRFEDFDRYFHPYLPLLHGPLPVAAWQKHSPFLFWTIITVSTRYRPLPLDNFKQYSEEYTALAQRMAMTSPITLHTIQALLLICSWPIPTRSQSLDPSYLYCSAAIAGSDFLNLNRPAGKYMYQGSQISEADLQSMSRTWLALLNVSSALELWYGTPKILRNAHDLATLGTHIDQASSHKGLAAESALIASITRFKGLVPADIDAAAHEALADKHLLEFNEIANRFASIWSKQLQLTALSVHLQLRTLCILAWGKEVHKSKASSHLKPQLGAAVTIAEEIVRVYESLLEIDKCFSLQVKFWMLPKSYYRILVYACFFLVRFCCASEICDEDARVTAQQTVGRARDLLSRCSNHIGGPFEGDEPGRASECLDVLLRHIETLKGQQALRIDDRGESSVVWDTLRHAYWLRGKSSYRTDLLEYIDPTTAPKRKQGSPLALNGVPKIPPPESQQAPHEILEDRAGLDELLSASQFDWFLEMVDFNATGLV
jgi:hypothetical protein